MIIRGNTPLFEWDKAYARLLVPAKGFGAVDLGDLCEHPWVELEVGGFDRLWISRADGSDLVDSEVAELERIVTEDIRYDYSEDEIEILFDDAFTEGVLRIDLQWPDETGEAETGIE